MTTITIATKHGREIKITLNPGLVGEGHCGVQGIYEQSYVTLEVDDTVAATLYPRNEALDDYVDGELGLELWKYDIETDKQSCVKKQDEVYSV